MSMKRELVDPATGELVEVLLLGKPKARDTGFVKFFIAFLEDLMLNKEIAGKAVRLLLYAISQMDWNSKIVYLYWADACKALQVDPTTYYRWLKALEKAGILQKVKPYVYELKAYTVIKGYESKAQETKYYAEETMLAKACPQGQAGKQGKQKKANA